MSELIVQTSLKLLGPQHMYIYIYYVCASFEGRNLQRQGLTLAF